jgi:hypothetical protein
MQYERDCFTALKVNNKLDKRHPHSSTSIFSSVTSPTPTGLFGGVVGTGVVDVGGGEAGRGGKLEEGFEVLFDCFCDLGDGLKCPHFGQVYSADHQDCVKLMHTSQRKTYEYPPIDFPLPTHYG